MAIYSILICIKILDGKDSNCPSSPSSLICLETNECNRCRYNSNKNEGCDSSSTKPICDMDEATVGYQTSATRKLAKCEPCKKSGNSFTLV